MNKKNIHEIIQDANQKGVEQAIELSVRTGVPLIIEKNGKIIEVKPKYKYVLMPIEKAVKRSKTRKAI